jgi:tRNA-splicing ligase RtcB (3'-phosphate/5'-hydroxy nucleic acid ligase)
VEETALEQAKNIANLPFAYGHVCLMPDVHSGYGMPIGGVFAAIDTIVPNAVGVDIGCGVCALQTDIVESELNHSQIKLIFSDVRKVIPLGFNHHASSQGIDKMPFGYNIDELPIVRAEYNSALKQIGTLGGGNHFIEIQSDKNGKVWIMIHSGSRNLGKKVADYYNNLAKSYLNAEKIAYNPKNDLAYFHHDHPYAQAYLREMNFCIAFAYENRKLMMNRICEILTTYFPCIRFGQFVNIAHNYAALENHFGKELFVHRKGATSAKENEIGIVPGSQGAKSYVVVGKGNKASFMSCSHGAGRLMSRAKAIKTLDIKTEVEKLENLGVVHSIRSKSDLEEASSAYKNIDLVMKCQSDLIDILFELKPKAVIKG